MCQMIKTQTSKNCNSTTDYEVIKPDIKEIDTIAEDNNDLTIENIIQHFPEKMRSRARLIGSFLKQDLQNFWNNKGELLYNGEPVLGSSVTDLLYDACCPKRKYEPKGMKTFYQILHTTNVPVGMIRNVDRRKWLNNSCNIDSVNFNGWQQY